MRNTLEEEFAQLMALPLVELRAEWHRWHFDRPIAERLPRDLLVRTIAWKMQQQQLGQIPAAITSRLDRLSAQLQRSGTLDLEREARLKTGTTLVRDWRGQTYRVTALEEGYLWEGQQYGSISEIARAITGVRWSGLKQRRPPSRANRELAHG